MKTTMLIAATALALTGMGTARADEDCQSRIGDWQPRSAVVKMAEERGWTVQRIKTDDGCYEIFCTDAEGRLLKVIVDPATLQVVATETRDGDGERHGGSHHRSYRSGGDDEGHGGRRDHEDDDDDDDDGSATPLTGPSDPNAPVPDNGLFKGKLRPKVQVQ